MRIAQVAPLFLRVPPTGYGAVERVVSYLTDELVRQGHDVTLFASGDSQTLAKLIAPVEEPLGWRQSFEAIQMAYGLQMELVLQNSAEFDVIHFHDRIHFPTSRRNGVPHVTTVHVPLDDPRQFRFHREFAEMPLVSVSDKQREPTPWLNWQATIYNGLPENLYESRDGDGGYLAFLGRLCPEKGLDKAVEIAKRSGLKLRVAGNKPDPLYFDRVMGPHDDDPLVEYIGEIGDSQKNEFLGNARAFLFPITWNEPLGLVMIEALACGTPIIAFRRGPVAEVIQDGKTGFIVDGIDEAVEAVGRVGALDRARCRQAFEERFGLGRTSREHLGLYARLQAASAAPERTV